MNKARLATIWFDNCSGCHMSLLDIDERLVAVAESIDLVYGPLVDAKEFPEGVDVTLVEGGIASEEDVEKIRKVRAKHQDPRVAGRLRGDGQRAGHAQHVRPRRPVSAGRTSRPRPPRPSARQ